MISHHIPLATLSIFGVFILYIHFLCLAEPLPYNESRKDEPFLSGGLKLDDFFFHICQAGMKAEHLVLMGHSLGAVQCQLYLSHGPGVGKFDALILTGSALLRKYRNSSAWEKIFSGAGEAF